MDIPTRARPGDDGTARLRALATAAYTATAGHLDVDPEPQDAVPARRRWTPSLRAALVAGLAVAALGGAVALWSWLGRPGEPVPLPEPAPAPAAEATASAAPAEPEEGTGTVVVHVAGAVREPGVVELAEGSRVRDAVEAVGGAAAEADLTLVNLARPLVDGEQVHLPAEGEEPDAGPPPAPGADPAVAGPGAGGEPAVVDLNAATAEQLESLPGIGPARAATIIEWRELNGGFRAVEDLLQVSGIGPATLERLRPQVTV